MRFFSKIDILSAKVYTKKAPNFEIVWPTPGTLRPLTVKGVYLVSHNLVWTTFWAGVYYILSNHLIYERRFPFCFIFILANTALNAAARIWGIWSAFSNFQNTKPMEWTNLRAGRVQAIIIVDPLWVQLTIFCTGFSGISVFSRLFFKWSVDLSKDI